MQPRPLRHPVRQSVGDRKAADPFQLCENDDHLPDETENGVSIQTITLDKEGHTDDEEGCCPPF